MKTFIFLGIYSILFYGAANAANWPDCISEGIDYTGDNVISGLRFSNEECALWCQRVEYFLFYKGSPTNGISFNVVSTWYAIVLD